MQDMFGEISLLLLPLAVIFLKEDNWDPTREAANDWLIAQQFQKTLIFVIIPPNICI